MSNIIFSINAVAPIFIVILVGAILKKMKILNDEFVNTSTKTVFKVAMPLMIFRSVSKTDFNQVFSSEILTMMIFAVSGILLIFLYSYIISRVFIVKNETRGAFVQAVFRSNYVIIGYPLIQNLFGEVGLSKAALLTAFTIPTFNILAVIILSITAKNENSKSKKNVLINIITNPLIISILISLVISYYRIDLPEFIDKTVDYFAQIATPLALLGIGAFFDIDKTKKCIKNACFATFFKMIINPLIFVSLAYMLGFRNESLGVLFVLFASPTAVSSFIMAKAMDSDSDLAANIIMLTTASAVVTIFIGVLILKSISAI